uniref:G-protein coupled receptors family 1 profile domain-containing protein n=1 Tax=Biomphalaria glabrata TaxID=6526 RepID=A0A2C9M7P9_BIOGL
MDSSILMSSQTVAYDFNKTVALENGIDEVGSADPISDDILRITMFVNYGIICGIISLTGVVLNSINIAVFISQGFHDTINITLLALSVADLGSLVTLVWMSLCYNPLVVGALPEINFIEVQHITAGWPHVCFTRISSWLMAFITVERYLCIALPLKVKALLTRGRTTCVVFGIFFVVIATVVPVYVAIHITSHTSGINSAKQYGIEYIPGGPELENVSVFCNSLHQISTFVIVIICTSGLVSKVTEKSKWRNATSSASKLESVSARDRKVVKLVIIIAVLFIVTFTPVVIHLLVMFCEHEFTVGRKYQNLFLFCGTFIFNLEAINAACSFFVYIKMSSKFRQVLMARFFHVKQTKD